MTVVKWAGRPGDIDELIVNKLLKVVNYFRVEEFLCLGGGSKLTFVNTDMLGIVRMRFGLEGYFTHVGCDLRNSRQERLAQCTRNVGRKQSRNALTVDLGRHGFSCQDFSSR